MAVDDIGPTSHSFISQRLKLSYADWGNKEAPLLILVHGGMDHARSWDWVARALRHDWHVVAPDLRGHGDSAWSPDGAYTAPFFVSDLAQLIHQLTDGPVAIVAHSLGGAISLRYAGLYPERVHHLAVIEGIGLSDQDDVQPVADRWRSFIEQRRTLSGRSARRYETVEHALARMVAENKHLSEEQARHLTVHGVSRNEDGSYSWKYDNYMRSRSPVDISDEELRALWNAIDCPVWLVHGADSWAKHPVENGRAAAFKHARVTSFEGAGHWVQHDRFDAFVSELREFLSSEPE
ncbi:MAG: alpha/beta hydrolase [Sphingobium sp.]|uniref:alpha/beta fold hydrolase n=1 Tax=Sphingobium sp. TaxID=1912891 RepID=UPI0029A58183|nr:alpha/beta hydrolase [Sphingobium sp.]MDX3909705.1 alpha/beta hydrolase [Sphingobium sp.]